MAAHQKRYREATFESADGVVRNGLTTPAAPNYGRLRRYLLEVASTPPLRGGDYGLPMVYALLGNSPSARDDVPDWIWGQARIIQNLETISKPNPIAITSSGMAIAKSGT